MGFDMVKEFNVSSFARFGFANAFGYGRDFSDGNYGANYAALDSDSIRIVRGADDGSCPFIRIRIWVYK